jgi:hypothetical protein
MSRAFALLAAFSTLALAAACGSSVVDQQTSGTGGATSTTTATSTATSTSSTGGAPTICGGEVGKPCGPDEFCHFDPGLTPCGLADGTGTCQPKPAGCLADCPGVCGCDGQFYCNGCSANAAGVDVNPTLTCVPQEDAYRAVSMMTSIPRFLVLKASPSRKLCFRLMVTPMQSTGIGIDGDGWSVMSAEVTDDPSDCDFPPGFAPPPDGPSFSTTMPSSMGSLGFTQSTAGCQVAINATLNLPGAPAWAPMQEQFYTSQALPIEGGCP